MTSEIDPPFASYHKIAESTSRWKLSEADTRLLTRATWVATEKIHGANFSFLINDEGIRCAKRKALLEPGESFFKHETVLARLRDPLLALFTQLQNEHPDLQLAQIYGELFGGGYPHPDVEPVANVQPIQTGVYYCPDIRFCAFDIVIETLDDEGEPSRVFLDYDQATALLDEVDIFYAEPLLVGSFEACLEMPIRFRSTLPERLELPPLAENNLAEGVVLKPEAFFEVESPKGPQRPVIKRKIPEFSEDARFHQSTRWPAATQDTSQYALDVLEWEMMALVVPNRIDNAISKIGRVRREDAKAVKQLVELFVEDVWEQLTEAQGEVMASVSADDRALLRAVLKDEAEVRVAEHLR